MGDAGAVVGIVSLALQVFQGLSQYYGQFKAFDDNIAQAIHRVERLHGTLAALDSPVRKLEVDDNAISEQVRFAITSSTEGLGKLQELVEKCSKVQVTTTFQSRLQIVKSKALFPFRKGTLDDLGKYLDAVQANLDTILQALQLDTMIQSNERAEERAVSILDQTDHINRRQIYQTELVESLERTSILHMQQTSNDSVQVQKSLENISLRVQILQEQVADQMSLLNPIAYSLKMGRFPAPSAIGEGVRSHSALTPFMRKLCERNGKCPCRPISSVFPTSYLHRFGVHWQRSYDHQRSCPLYKTSQSLDTIGAQYVYYGRLMITVIQASITCRRGAGGFSISSTLNVGRSISFNHPSMRLLPDQFTYWHISSIDSFEETYSRPAGGLDKVLEFVKREMDEMFRNGKANPLDKTLNNESYLQLACHFVRGKAVYQNHSTESMLDFLRFFINAGVPLHEDPPDEDRKFGIYKSPLDYLLQDVWETNFEGQEYLCLYLAEKGAQWTCEWISYKRNMMSIPETSRWIAKVLAKESFREAYCGSPLEIAILHKSALKVLELMPKQEQSNDNGIKNLLSLSADWPEGLKMLLNKCASNSSVVESGEMALRNAFIWRNHEAVDILIAVGCEISGDMWKTAVMDWDKEVVYDLIDRIANISSKRRLRSMEIDDLFYTRGISVDIANHLYGAGFQNVDCETAVNAGRGHTPGTQLWRHSEALLGLIFSTQFDLFENMKFLHWLVEKGARADYLHTKVGTTPAHLLSVSLTHYFFLIHPDHALRLLKQEGLDGFFANILAMHCVDRCNCACSQSGCYPISSAVKFMAWAKHIHWLIVRERFPDVSLDEVYNSRIRVLAGVLPFLEHALAQRSSLAIAVLRVLTFEGLGITHTCHDAALSRAFHSKSPIPIPEEEMAELQDEDRNLIDRLEELMIEFEEKWNDHEGTFQDFVRGYWAKRINEELAYRKNITAEEIQAIQETGVVIQQCYGPVIPLNFMQEDEEGE